MLLFKINKWILNLAILASLVAFSGYSESQVKTASYKTEWVARKPISKLSFFYFKAIKNVGNQINYFDFSFQSLLKDYNLKTNFQEKTNKSISLQYINTLRIQELLNSIARDDFHDIFSG